MLRAYLKVRVTKIASIKSNLVKFGFFIRFFHLSLVWKILVNSLYAYINTFYYFILHINPRPKS